MPSTLDHVERELKVVSEALIGIRSVLQGYQVEISRDIHQSSAECAEQ